MKSLRSAGAVALAVAASACAPVQWVDIRTGSPQGAEAALDECRTLARTEAWRGQWYDSWPPLFYEPDPRYPGWRRPFWHGRPFSGDLYLRLEDFCMRSRGYRLVEKPEP